MLSIQLSDVLWLTKESWENPCWENHFKFYVAAFRRWRKKVCLVNSQILKLIILFLMYCPVHPWKCTNNGEIKHLQAKTKISSFPEGSEYVGWVKNCPGQLTLWIIHLIFISQAFLKPVFIRFYKLKLHFLGVAFERFYITPARTDPSYGHLAFQEPRFQHLNIL